MKKQVIFLAVFTFIGFGLLYWLLKPASLEPTGPQDDDHDGIENAYDQERNTAWPLDTAVFKIKDYVDAVGRLDPKKIKALCDCWKVPDVALRKQLPCENNNAYWWMFGDSLYEIRKENGDVRFYSGEGVLMRTQDDNDLEKAHKGAFPEFYASETPEPPLPPSPDPDRMIEITYKGERYTIKQGFTSEEGLEYGSVEPLPLWRYRNNTWQKAPNPNTPVWEMATKKDVDVMNKKFRKKVNDGGGNQGGGSQGGGGQGGGSQGGGNQGGGNQGGGNQGGGNQGGGSQGDVNQGTTTDNDDGFWVRYSDLLKANKHATVEKDACLIKVKYQDKESTKKLSEKGKSARQKVWNLVKEDCP